MLRIISSTNRYLSCGYPADFENLPRKRVRCFLERRLGQKGQGKNLRLHMSIKTKEPEMKIKTEYHKEPEIEQQQEFGMSM